MELQEKSEKNHFQEKQTFLNENRTKETPKPGCCRSAGTRICCIITAVLGGLFLILGVVVMLVGGPYLEKKIIASMALTPGSDRYESWLRPPVQPHLEGYAFHITNPEAVLAGKEPVVEEVGPFVYKSTTLKDSDDNVQWKDDGTLIYRPRKVYQYEPALSGNKDPSRTFITVPNIPFWTGLNKARSKSGFAKNIAIDIIKNNGLGKPFINVSFSGLLWGYEDELPCLSLSKPGECSARSGVEEPDTGFSDDDDDSFGGFGDDGDDDGFGFDMGFGDDSGSDSDSSFGGFGGDDQQEEQAREAMPKPDYDEDDGSKDEQFEPPKDSYWESLVKPKAEFVDCKCNWGLFRDRNITMRKPLRIFNGQTDLGMKGVVEKYDGKTTLGWWKKGSVCDKVKGQDSSTLPPGLTPNRTLDIYIALMCRTIQMNYEQEVEHAGIKTLRFIPPMNALGRHDDPNPEMRNPDNECYCLESEGFKCFKSGVMYMEPCKRKDQAPVALSMPHFYQADPEFRQRVKGLNPVKEKHQFYMDVVPEFGFPLAIRPRFQLNVIIYGEPAFDEIKNVQNDLVVPFLWAQDGFDEPSEEMADAIAFGLKAPEKLPLLGSVVCLVIGAILLLISLGYFFWYKRSASHDIKEAL